MNGTIMDDRDRSRGCDKSVLDVNRRDTNVVVSFKEVIDISSDDESADSDEDNTAQPRANTTKMLKKTGSVDYISLVQGVLNNLGQGQDQDRVQGGRISKRKGRRAARAQSISDKIANRRHPLQPIEEHRQQQRSAHVPIPQGRTLRSGRGQIPQYGHRLAEGIYSKKSLASKVEQIRRGEYAQGQRNLPCLPFILQITILRSLQRALESMCYRFVEKWLPRVLKENEWDCPDAIELSIWWRAIDDCKVPVEAVDLQGNRSLCILFRRVKDIRHLAVHRLPDVSIASIQEMITDALDIARVFRDDSFVPNFRLWREKLDYFSGVIMAARGNLDTVRKLDSINTLKEANASSQGKLREEIEALKNEILGKEEQIKTLKEEYNIHRTNETEIANNAPDRGPDVLQEGEQRSKSLGSLKWLEECFTLNFDRDAPNGRAEGNLSGQLITIKDIGVGLNVPARPANVGGANNVNGSGSRSNANVNLMTGRPNAGINPAGPNQPANVNFMPDGQNAWINPNVALRPGTHSQPANVNFMTVGQNVWINPDIAQRPRPNGRPQVDFVRRGSIPDILLAMARPEASARANTNNLGPLAGIPGLGRLGQRAVSGPVLRTHTNPPIPPTAVFVDLTEDDDDPMSE